MNLQYEAAVLHTVGAPLAVERVNAAALGGSDVLVRVRAAGLCHTDLEVIEGSLRYPMPILLGHEAAGVVEEVGPAVTKLRTHLAEQPNEWQIEQPCFQIPQGCVDRGNCHRTNSGTAEIANRMHHRLPTALDRHRVATEHNLQRAFTTAVDQLNKLNQLVLPVTKAEAATITEKALTDLRTVRRNALGAVATAIGLGQSEADVYVRTTDAALEGQTFANEGGVLLAPDLNGIVNRATQLYAQVGDAAAKQLTQPRAAPSSSPSASPRP